MAATILPAGEAARQHLPYEIICAQVNVVQPKRAAAQSKLFLYVSSLTTLSSSSQLGSDKQIVALLIEAFWQQRFFSVARLRRRRVRRARIGALPRSTGAFVRRALPVSAGRLMPPERVAAALRRQPFVTPTAARLCRTAGAADACRWQRRSRCQGPLLRLLYQSRPPRPDPGRCRSDTPRSPAPRRCA